MAVTWVKLADFLAGLVAPTGELARKTKAHASKQAMVFILGLF